MEYKGATNLSELNYWLNKHIMIRRLKEQVLKDLPDKTRNKISVDVSQKYK